MTGPTILLTGSGTVGRELLLTFLRGTDATVTLLMRDRGRRTAASRAEALFETAGKLAPMLAPLMGELPRDPDSGGEAP